MLDGGEGGSFPAARVEGFLAAMQAHSLPASFGVARYVDWSRHKKVLDIGGGTGCFMITLASAHPHLSTTVAELAPVTKIAERYIANAQAGSRVSTVAISMFRDAEF